MKKIILLFTLTLTLILAACGNSDDVAKTDANSSDDAKLTEVKFGYQKGMPLLSLLKEKSDIENRLAEIGYKVTWSEFAATPAMLEAMVPNGIVFGGGGATGSIFAQQAGRTFKRVAAQTGVAGGSAVIVPGDSDVQSVADLRGKTVAVAKGTSQHYMLAQALAQAGLTVADVNLTFINPAEAFPAFGKGDIAAWAIWDPFTAEAEVSFDARVIADNQSVFGEQANIEGENLYYTEATFLEQNPEVIDIVLDELSILGKWVNENTDEAAEILAKMYSSDVNTQKIVENRGGTREILPMNDETIAPLVNITEFFVAEGVLTEGIDVTSDEYNWKK